MKVELFAHIFAVGTKEGEVLKLDRILSLRQKRNEKKKQSKKCASEKAEAFT